MAKKTLLLCSPPPESEQKLFCGPAWTECLRNGKALQDACKVQGYSKHFED